MEASSSDNKPLLDGRNMDHSLPYRRKFLYMTGAFLLIVFRAAETFFVQFGEGSPYELFNPSQDCRYSLFFKPGFEKERESTWGVVIIFLGIVLQSVLYGHEFLHLPELYRGFPQRFSAVANQRDHQKNPWCFLGSFVFVGLVYAVPSYIIFNCGLLLSFNAMTVVAVGAATASFFLSGIFFAPLVSAVLEGGPLAAASFMGFALTPTDEALTFKHPKLVFGIIFVFFYVLTIAGMYSLTAVSGLKTEPEDIFTGVFSALTNIPVSLWHASHWAVACSKWTQFKRRFLRAPFSMRLLMFFMAVSYAVPAGMALKRSLGGARIVFDLTLLAFVFDALRPMAEAIAHFSPVEGVEDSCPVATYLVGR
jgi:hypothetical protein